jgi:hypothetical protein
MRRNTPTRFVIALLFCVPFLQPRPAAAQVDASRGKPSAIPSSGPNGSPAATVAATPQTPAQRPARRAEVTYQLGQLAINADNSSLNQILREVGRETGIKITGGVADERVFGKYGPSPPSEVLASLLDGTGSNVLLIQSDSTSPGELILTPRHGGPTPPNPSAQGFEDESPSDDATPPQPQPQPQTPAPDPPPPAANTAPVSLPTPNTPATPATQPASTPAATDATDPNAVKTPQDIFQQLQRLRQQPPQ